MRKGGEHYEYISRDKRFSLIEYYVDSNHIEEAYKVANENGNQMARELTLYLLKEHSEVFAFDPLKYLTYVPENFLYECVDEDLCVYVHDGIKEIRDGAFAFCKIKKIIISNKVKRIGDGALSLNAGEIEYQGSAQEFVNTCLGRSKCFEGSHNHSIEICCNNGPIVVEY